MICYGFCTSSFNPTQTHLHTAMWGVVGVGVVMVMMVMVVCVYQGLGCGSKGESTCSACRSRIEPWYHRIH